MGAPGERDVKKAGRRRRPARLFRVRGQVRLAYRICRPGMRIEPLRIVQLRPPALTGGSTLLLKVAVLVALFQATTTVP